MGSLRVSRIEASEVALHRELRVAALRESPEAFGQRVTDVENDPLEAWRAGTRSAAEGVSQVMFVVRRGAEPVGMVYGLPDPAVATRSRVGGMWVSPAERRGGAGRALLSAVVDWAIARGSERVALWAPSKSVPAIRLYASTGFAKTGTERPFPNRPGEVIVEMELQLRQP